jgi:hypothetical protein
MKRHPFDVFSFILGIVATLVGATFFLGGEDVDIAWVGPALLIGVGLAIVGGIVQRSLPARQSED